MNLRVGKFLSGWGTGGLSRRAQVQVTKAMRTKLKLALTDERYIGNSSTECPVPLTTQCIMLIALKLQGRVVL
jgi:hypothetical protein